MEQKLKLKLRSEKMEQIRILLVDDHEVVRVGLQMLLTSQKNFKVVGGVGSVQEAMEFLSNNEVDVLITDITMPDQSGIELVQKVSSKYKQINVMMLTMHLEDTFVLASVEAGSKGYVVKDSDQADVINAINTVAKGEMYLTGVVSDILAKSLLRKNKQEEIQEGFQLSVRELEVLDCIVNGLSNKMIGPKLNISERTVNVHRYNIMKKVNAGNTADLVRIAMNSQLVKSE
jgi:DNA-binding NarL/FixJ family response regulator